ncbi:hypothetical protein Tco_0171894, partial [Tanacetum coccineum]
PKKVVERETEETTDKEQSNFQGSTTHIPPPVNPIPILEPDVPKTLPKPNIPIAPTIRNLLMNKEKLLELAKISLNENCSAMLLKKLPEKLGDPGKFLIQSFYKEKLLELAKIPLNENCSAMLLKKLPEKSLEISTSFLFVVYMIS